MAIIKSQAFSAENTFSDPFHPLVHNPATLYRAAWTKYMSCGFVSEKWQGREADERND